MLDNFVYVDHVGRKFSGREHGVYINYNDMRNYEWKYSTINSRLSRFYTDVTNRTLPLVLAHKTAEEARTIRHRLFSLTEGDIAAMKPGKIYIGDYYTQGYITSSKKSAYLVNDRYCALELRLTSDDPMWYKERQYVFTPGSNETGGSTSGADYPYDYPYDFAVNMNGRSITNDAITESAFRMTIHGQATNPTITINDHEYTVNGTVGVGEMLVIDSISKKITLIDSNGKETNWFDKRGRDDYIFKPIPAGSNMVNWIGNFGFNLTVIEKRSEPAWI